ncbi:MAG TPA: polysaccharide deacetylase family protein [Candidatus Acidoferrum sp.]|nr:polysaccharide deacetylase family protein [Candidatus Acidoferrum sp.]
MTQVAHPISLLFGIPVGLLIYVFLVEPLWVLPWLERLTPGILYRVKTREALVALSFDDGPHGEFTPQVLEILERYEARATFFLIGERAERNPVLMERIRAAGHEIGNHCWRDGSVLGHSRARFAEELERTERATGLGAPRRREVEDKELTQRAQREEHREHREEREHGQSRKMEIEDGKEKTRVAAPDSVGDVNPEVAPAIAAKAASSRHTPTRPAQKSAPTTAWSSLRFFRAPGGVAWPWQLRMARERGYTCVLGCAYPHDPMRPPEWYIRWLIRKNLRRGTIVILHDGIRDASRSVAALPDILEEGKRRGLRFVSIGSLIDGSGQEAGSDRSMP